MEEFLKKIIFGVSVGKLLAVLLAAIISILIINFIGMVIKRFVAKKGRENAGTGFVLSVVKVVLYFIVIVSLGESIGIPMSSFIALLSVVGLAISLSVQNLLTNLMGGLVVLFTKPFKQGDCISFGEYEGCVSEVGMMYTRIVNYDNHALLIPNKDISSSVIINYSRLGTRRICFDIGFSYEEDPEKVRNALILASKIDRVLDKPEPQVVILKYSSSSVDYSLRVWVKEEDYWDVLYAVNERIKEFTEKLGVEITYNHLNVHLTESKKQM